MKTKRKTLFQFIAMVVVVILVGLNFLLIVQAGPPAQDPRPPSGGGTGGGGGGGGTPGGGGSGGDSNGTTIDVDASGVPGCASLTGQIINWGFGPQGDVGVELKTGSWRNSTVSASDGKYGLGGLGVGIATLNVDIAPGDPLKPLVKNAGVYLNCNYPLVANLAVSSGSPVESPATIEMSAPSQAIIPDSNFKVTLTIKNGLPNDITNVVVTDLMPQGLTAVQLGSSIDPQDAQIINGSEDGQLVVVYLEKLAAGAEAEIELTLHADVDLVSSAKIQNAATLFYRESVADQASLEFTVGSDGLPVLTASAGGGPGADFVPPAEAPTTGGSFDAGTEVSAGSAEPASTGRNPAPTTGDDFVPPSNMPSTGGEIDLPLDKLDPTGLINLAEARLVVGREATEGNDTSTHTSNLIVTADGAEQDKVVVVYNTAAREPPVTVATSLLFLGLLVLGSGLTLWHRRSDSL